MSGEFEVNLDIDSHLNGALIVKCPECEARTRKVLEELAGNNSIACECDHVMVVSEEIIAKSQRNLESMRKSMKGYGSK